MDNCLISSLAFQLRSSPRNKTDVFTVSTRTLLTLLRALDSMEEQPRTFNAMQSSIYKVELSRDLQYLHTYCQQVKGLKLYGDPYDEELDFLDITLFKSIFSFELVRVDVNTIKGLQTLRPHLHKLVCQRAPNSLGDVLSSCGADKGHSYCWNELKELVFVSNNMVHIDQSLECAPWLHHLDLSHNEISNVEALSALAQLKYLNLSYNKVEVIPQFKGRICGYLQHLIIKNNFIEDIGGLEVLTSLCVLDLGNNCLLDHKCLLGVSHLATLQWLNLEGNPLSFHPKHRRRAATYLHPNTATVHFTLDRSGLSKGEKKIVGCYYPAHSKSSASMTDSCNMAGDKARKVRHVVIEEQNGGGRSRDIKNVEQTSSVGTPQQHLETKKQIEDLHQKFGESWLNSQSGALVHSMLGLESSLREPSAPYRADFERHSGDIGLNGEGEKVEPVVESPEVVCSVSDPYEKDEAPSQDDVDVEGEESIYLATVNGEVDPIFIVIGQTHIFERECATGNELGRWHLDSIANCDIIQECPNMVQLDFETMRKDRKQRIYVFEEEIEVFVACIKSKMDARQPKNDGGELKYQCIKCLMVFSKVKNESVLGEASVNCPTCDSNLVVEYV